MVQTIAIQDENVRQRLIQDDSVMIKDGRIFNKDVMEVSVMKKEKDACEGAGKTNIFIASFTTALARLKLYAELEKSGEQVLYYDTDSVIYRWKEGESFIPPGIFLGEMTDELGGIQLWSLDQLVQNPIAIKHKAIKRNARTKARRARLKLIKY